VAARHRPDGGACHGGALFDLSRVAPTTSQLFELDAPAAAVRAALATAPRVADFTSALANSDESVRDERRPWLLAPCDLQVIKASGVTFVASLLERVIEEQARGDASKAEASAARCRASSATTWPASCPARPRRRASSMC